MVLASTSVTALLVTSTFCRERRGVGFHNHWGAGGRTSSPWTAPASAPPPTSRSPAVVWLWPGRVTVLGVRRPHQLPWYLLHFFEVFIKLGPFSPSDLLADQLGDRRRETSVSLRRGEGLTMLSSHVHCQGSC